MVKEHKKIGNRINALQSQLKTLPDGKLVCASNGKWKKWYHSTKQGTTYLPKKNRKLAEDLAYKKYVLLQLENLNCEKEAINLYLDHHDQNARQREEELFYSPDFHSLLQARLTPLSEELQTWMTMPYNKNTNHPENLNNKAYSGNMVRSKSEVLIDMFLFKNKIPFRYEAILQLNKTILYPDFTIRHPRTGKYFYCEKCGSYNKVNQENGPVLNCLCHSCGFPVKLGSAQMDAPVKIDKAWWSYIKECVRKEGNISDISYDTWIQPLDYTMIENRVFIIAPYEAKTIAYVRDKYREIFKIVINRETRKHYIVSFVQPGEILIED